MKARKSRVQRILLIDDSAEDRARIRAALIQGAPDRRFQFREASNGAEGLQLCRDSDGWPIDCVIIDIHMPKVTGPEFLKILREPYDFPILPVVVLTGSSMNQDASEALQLGAQDYVTKDSLYPSVLFRVVDNAIERHQLLRDLHQSRIAADAANRAKSAMVGSISHEIRTPMTAVLGLCDVLLDSQLDDDQINLLQMIRDNGEYLVEIVNDLLDLSKLEAGGLEIEHEPFRLREMLQRIVQLMQVRAAQYETDLKLEIDEAVPNAIFSDPIRLRQILLNLVSNAVKFSPGGSVTIKTTIAKDDPDVELLRIAVADTGVGIPTEDLEKIFQPFVQSESKGRAKSIGGTGLGLAICRRLVALLNGNLTVSSEVDHGSVFTLNIPLYPAADEQIRLPDYKRALSSTVEELLDGCHVLVAEDTRATQVLLIRILEAVGAKVTTVDSGQALIDRFKESPSQFELLVTDIQMPGMDGLEATRQLRQLGCSLPIVVLTADAISETREDAAAAGATDILTKPIDRTMFLETIAHYCDSAACED